MESEVTQTVGIPDEQLATLREQSASGNQEAQSILKELGHDKAPEKKPESEKTEEGAGKGNPPKVEKPLESDGKPVEEKTQHRSKIEDIRRLRQERRELREQNSALMQRLEALEKKTAESTAQKVTPEPVAAEDDGTEIFTNPKAYLERMIRNHLKKIPELSDLPNIISRQLQSTMQKTSDSTRAFENVK